VYGERLRARNLERKWGGKGEMHTQRNSQQVRIVRRLLGCDLRGSAPQGENSGELKGLKEGYRHGPIAGQERKQRSESLKEKQQGGYSGELSVVK